MLVLFKKKYVVENKPNKINCIGIKTQRNVLEHKK